MKKKSELESARATIQAVIKGKTLLRVNYAAWKREDVAHGGDARFFLAAGWYRDEPFHCVDCGKLEIWKDTQQKWWYEIAKGSILTMARRCRACRRIHREMGEVHRVKTLAEYLRKRSDDAR